MLWPFLPISFFAPSLLSSHGGTQFLLVQGKENVPDCSPEREHHAGTKQQVEEQARAQSSD